MLFCATGDFAARKERLLRDIMAVDNVSFSLLCMPVCFQPCWRVGRAGGRAAGEERKRCRRQGAGQDRKFSQRRCMVGRCRGTTRTSNSTRSIWITTRACGSTRFPTRWASGCRCRQPSFPSLWSSISRLLYGDCHVAAHAHTHTCRVQQRAGQPRRAVDTG